MKLRILLLTLLMAVIPCTAQLDYGSQVKNKPTDTTVGGIKGGFIWNGAADPNSYVLPPIVVQTAHFSSGGNGVMSFAATTSSPVTAGHLLIVSLSGNPVGGTATVTDSLGTAYTNYGGIIFYGKATSSGIDTVTSNETGAGYNLPSLTVTEFSNVQAVLDVSPTTWWNATHSVNVTTNYTGDLVYGLGHQSCNAGAGGGLIGAYSPGSGETLIYASGPADPGGAVLAEYKVGGNPGVITTTTVGADGGCSFYTEVLAFKVVTSVIGNNGDYYINSSTNTLFGPKLLGEWSSTGTKLGTAGFSGTKTAGSCVLTLVNGVTTDISGC